MASTSLQSGHLDPIRVIFMTLKGQAGCRRETIPFSPTQKMENPEACAAELSKTLGMKSA
jgi:hypothetical protein